MAKKILMIVGSMRKESLNRQLAQKAAGYIGEKAETSFLEYAELPYMNQDIEFPVPEQVERVRKEIAAADGIWVVTPEYNFSYPGVLKNLLDWMSRPLKADDFKAGTAMMGKKVTVSGASGKSAAAGARKKLKELLAAMRTQQMEDSETGVALAAEAFQTNKLALSEENEQSLKNQAEAFLNFIGA